MACEEERRCPLTLVEILEDDYPIDLNKYPLFVRSPHSGAVATFAGTTRDTFDGKPVVELRYEAYVPMALRRLRSVCSSARSLWSLDKIAVAHRTGLVPVAETSVFVAVSAVHRGPALDACRYIIDELKASVPIWKKEVYSNGEVWKENSEFHATRLASESNGEGRGWATLGEKSLKSLDLHLPLDTGGGKAQNKTYVYQSMN